MKANVHAPRPQLTIDELYQLKWILGSLLALLAGSTVLYMEVQAWASLVLIAVAVPEVIRRPWRTVQIPRWAYRLAFPSFVAFFAVDWLLNREILPPIVRLTLLLVLYRTVTPRRRRDDLQLVLLGLFLVVVAGVLSVSIFFAVQIVVFTAVALAFLLVITLVDTVDSDGSRAVGDTKHVPAWMTFDWRRLLRRLRETTDWRVAALGGALFAGVVVLSGLLFLAIPRFEIANSLFFERMMTRKSKSGFNDTIKFGDVVDIQKDTSVALTVDVSDRSLVPVAPYWRMLVLDDYAGGQFRMSPELKTTLRSSRDKIPRVFGGARPQPGAATWTVYMEPGTSRYLPLVGGFYDLTFNEPQLVRTNEELLVFELQQEPTKLMAFRVTGMQIAPALGAPEMPRRSAPVRRAADGKPIPAPTFLGKLADPEDNARLANWLAELGGPGADVKEFSRRATRWLERRHVYSTQSTLAEGSGDPLVRWMASSGGGHCELFAGAMTLLARTAGYPARIVTGFRGGTWNPHSENLIVRNSDAHAWCELWDAATASWVRVDPTPGALAQEDAQGALRGDEAIARISDRSWSARFDSVRTFWYRRIVSFDQTTQLEMARAAKEAVQNSGRDLKEAVQKRLRELRAWLLSPWDVRRVVGWSAGLIGVVGLVWAWKRFGRGAWLRWRSSLAARSGVDPVRREASRWLAKLKERAEADAAAHRSSAEQRRRAAVARTELERLRFGPRQSWPADVSAVFRQAKAALRGR